MKRVFSKKNIYYFLYTTLLLSFFVLYLLIGYKLVNKLDIARTNLFDYEGDFGSEIYLNLKNVYYEMAIYTKYYEFVAICIFIIGFSFGIQLFRFIGFKINIIKKSKEEFSYEFISSIIVDLIILLIIILVFLLFNKEQITSLWNYNGYLILLLYSTLYAIRNYIVKKKVKKLEIAKVKEVD